MSSSPECRSCGIYIHSGPVICEDCISKRLTTARESAAREMRERIISLIRNSIWSQQVRDILIADINAIPLTPADGAKDE